MGTFGGCSLQLTVLFWYFCTFSNFSWFVPFIFRFKIAHWTLPETTSFWDPFEFWFWWWWWILTSPCTNSASHIQGTTGQRQTRFLSFMIFFQMVSETLFMSECLSLIQISSFWSTFEARFFSSHFSSGAKFAQSQIISGSKIGFHGTKKDRLHTRVLVQAWKPKPLLLIHLWPRYLPMVERSGLSEIKSGPKVLKSATI